MISNQTMLMLNFFDACGFNTGASKLFQYQKFKYFVFLIQILLALLLTIFKFHLLVRYYSALAIMEAISESLQYSTALFTFWLIILDSILHHRDHRRFWATFEKIDECFCHQLDITFRSYFFKAIEFFSVTILALAIRIRMSDNQLSTDIAYVILFEICLIRIFHFLFCLEVVRFQLQMIENETKTMKNVLNSISIKNQCYLIYISETSNFYFFEQQRLKWIREYFYNIYKMVDLLNKTFGWSQVAAISFCYHLLLTELTWLYLHFFRLDEVRLFG